MPQIRATRGRPHVTLRQESAYKIKILAAQHDVFQGDVVEAGLALLEELTPIGLAEHLASFDRREGRLVAADEPVDLSVKAENLAHQTTPVENWAD